MVSVQRVRIQITAAGHEGKWKRFGTFAPNLFFEEEIYVQGHILDDLSRGDVKGELHRALDYVLGKIDDKRRLWEPEQIAPITVEVKNRLGDLTSVEKAKRDDAGYELDDDDE